MRRCLRGAVCAELCSRREHVLGRNEDNISSRPLCLEVPGRFGKKVKRPFDIHALKPLEGRRIHLCQRRYMCHSRIHDQEIDPAPRFAHRTESSGDGLRIGHIKTHTHHPFAENSLQAVHHGSQPVSLDICGGDVTALFQKHLAYPCADRPCRPGNQCHSPAKGKVLPPGELRMLQRPVLHGKELLFAQTLIRSHSGNRLLYCKCLCRDIARDIGFLHILAGANHSNARHDYHSRDRVKTVKSGCHPGLMPRHICGVLEGVPSDGGGGSLQERLRIFGGVAVDPQGERLCSDQMIRCQGRRQDDLPASLRFDEVQRFLCDDRPEDESVVGPVGVSGGNRQKSPNGRGNRAVPFASGCRRCRRCRACAAERMACIPQNVLLRL